MKHSSLLGGSIAGRRLNCPGSYKLEETVPTNLDVESGYAIRGTALHDAMAAFLTEGEDVSMSTLVGREFYGRTISAEDVKEALSPAISSLDNVIKQAGGECDLWIEQAAVFLQPTVDSPGSFGTIDVILRSPAGHYYILDWKFGLGVSVGVQDNSQLLYYATALAADPGDTGFTVDSPLTVGIIQPGDTEHPEDGALRLWEVPRDVIRNRTTIYRDAADRALASTMQRGDFTMGDHCRWCKAVAICPAQIENSNALVQTSRSLQGDMWAHVTGDALAAMLDQAEQVEMFLSELRKYAHSLLDAGSELQPTGYKLVPKRGTRKWTDEEKATIALKKRLGAKSFNKKLLSPAQAEKKLTKRVFSQFFEPMIDKKSSGKNMVRDDNEKEALTPSQPLALAGEPVLTQ